MTVAKFNEIKVNKKECQILLITLFYFCKLLLVVFDIVYDCGGAVDLLGKDNSH